MGWRTYDRKIERWERMVERVNAGFTEVAAREWRLL